MADPIDLTDPCQRAEALRRAYYDLVAGQRVAAVSYSTGGASREVRYSAADRTPLLAELRRAEAECDESRGQLGGGRVNTVRIATSKGVFP